MKLHPTWDDLSSNSQQQFTQVQLPQVLKCSPGVAEITCGAKSLSEEDCTLPWTHCMTQSTSSSLRMSSFWTVTSGNNFSIP